MHAAYARAQSTLCALLQEGVASGVFPGAVAAIGALGERSETRIAAAAGALAADEPPVLRETPYDLASLTKPIVAVAALRLSQRGVVDLQAPIEGVLWELEGTPGGELSLALLLSHRARLAAWLPLYQRITAPAGSRDAKRELLRAAATSVDDRLPYGQSVYSDLGYLLVGETLARAAGVPLEAVVQREVTATLGLDGQLFYAAALANDARDQLRVRVAPTENDPGRGGVLRGQVHDENGHAFGGIAGHAGLFGTADAVLTFGLAVLEALEGRSSWLDQALLRWALTPHGPGYVVGWDTKSEQGSSAGSLFSPRSFGHLGFTGTSIWCDPTRRSCAVLLSNRVHPSRDNIAIRGFRPRFHDGAIALFRAYQHELTAQP